MHRLILTGALALLAGCSADSGLEDSGFGDGDGNGNGTGTGGGPGDTLLPGNLTGGDDTNNVPRGVDGCGGDVYRGEAVILDMYILMDRSGSMVGFGASTLLTDVWTPIGTAIGEFVVNPNSNGISAGIGFFPLDGQECDVPAYANPAAPIGALTANGPAIQQAIQTNGPLFGGTPTVPAITGAMQYTKQWATANPSHKTILVLATDGDPNDCNSSVQGVAQVAADGRASSPLIDTYVIGIGNVAGLNEIATAGGSGQALLVSTDPSVSQQEFSAAMDQIRGRAIPCDFGIPAQGQGTPDKVNFKFSSPNDAERLVPRVLNPTDCGATEGWYYDNNDAPSRITVCPATCDLVSTTAQAEVSVVVGCAQVLR